MNVLTKTTGIYQRDLVLEGTFDVGQRHFSQLDEDVDFRSVMRKLVLDADTWLELGSPEEITVTIEPGDRLNDDA